MILPLLAAQAADLGRVQISASVAEGPLYGSLGNFLSSREVYLPDPQVAVSRDGRWAAVGQGPSVSVWELGTGRILFHGGLSTPADVTALALHEGRAEVITGASDGTVTVWSLADGAARWWRSAHTSPVVSVAADGEDIVSVSAEAVARHTPEGSGDLSALPALDGASEWAASPDGRRVVFVSGGELVSGSEAGRVAVPVPACHQGPDLAVAWEAGVVAAFERCGGPGALVVRAVGDLRELWRAPATTPPRPPSPEGWDTIGAILMSEPDPIAVSPDGRAVALLANGHWAVYGPAGPVGAQPAGDQVMRVVVGPAPAFRVTTVSLTQLCTWPAARVAARRCTPGDADPPQSMEIVGDDLVVVHRSGRRTTVPLAAGRRTTSRAATPGFQTWTSPHGRYALERRDTLLRVRDLRTGALVGELPAAPSDDLPAEDVAFAADDAALALEVYGDVWWVDLPSLEIRVVPRVRPTQLALSPHGDRLAGVVSFEVRVWDRLTVEAEAESRRLPFTPRVVFAGDDLIGFGDVGATWVWRPSDPEAVTVEGLWSTSSLVVSRDGRYAWAGDGDGQALLDVAARRVVRRVSGARDAVFSQDGASTLLGMEGSVIVGPTAAGEGRELATGSWAVALGPGGRWFLERAGRVLRARDTATGAVRCDLLVDEHGWAAWTPDGAYDASSPEVPVYAVLRADPTRTAPLSALGPRRPGLVQACLSP